MTKPNQPRDIKPKIDKPIENTKQTSNMQIVLINVITTMIVCLVFIFANYYIQNNLLTSKLAPAEEEVVVEDEDAMQKGFVYNLGEFTVNLADTSQRHYLKAEVSIELTKTEEEAASEKEPKKSGGGGHGGHGGDEGAAADPNAAIEKKLGQYKAAIRDAIIITLSNKTTDELSSVAGKEVVKEQIAQSVDAIMGGEREVIRVSFCQFIIQ